MNGNLRALDSADVVTMRCAQLEALLVLIGCAAGSTRFGTIPDECLEKVANLAGELTCDIAKAFGEYQASTLAPPLEAATKKGVQH